MSKARLLLITAIFLTIASLPEASSTVDDSDIINPNWIKPGWNSHHHREDATPTAAEDCKCPAVPKCNVEPPPKRSVSDDEKNRMAFGFYKKFLTRLFDERRLVLDSEDATFKQRNIQFRITDKQLSMLKESQNARDLQAIVASIVEQSDDRIYESVAEVLCWNLVAWYGSAMQSSIFLYVVIPVAVLLFVLILGRLLRVPLYILIPVICIGVTYVMMYRDCNNRLELESLAKLLKSGDTNPCARSHQSGWISYFKPNNDEENCLEHLRAKYGLQRHFCDPSEVFVEMTTKLQMQYIKSFVLETIDLFKVSTESSWLPGKLLIGVFILGVLYIMLTVGLKSTIYAGGRIVSDLLTRPKAMQGESGQPQAQVPQAAAPVNISISINRPRRTNSRVEAITNRIEEVAEGGDTSEPQKIAALPPATVEGSQQQKDESGDGPAICDAATSECESSDEEMIMVRCSPTDGGGDGQ